MGERIDLCGANDVADGGVIKVEKQGLTLAVYKVDGEVFVTDDHCTHGPGSLSEGVLDGYTIECDFHQGCFDIRTGAVTAAPCMIPIKTYPAVMNAGRVTIDVVGHATKSGAPVMENVARETKDARRIQIQGSGTFNCAPGDTVLRSALRAGHGFPYACNVGSCGNCRFELVEGSVAHRRKAPPAWTDRDREKNRWLGCQAEPSTDCVIRVRLDTAGAPGVRPTRRTARLTEVIALTHDMSEFGFSLQGPDAFLPGQYALFDVGLEFARPYSMCNLPGGGEWRFQVKRVPGGATTTSLFEKAKVGDELTLDGPYGSAYLRDDAPRDLVLVAGGSGLSPMVSIARAASVSPSLASRRIDFFYGARTPKDICGEAHLRELPGYGDRLRYVAAVSEPSSEWTGESGFIHEVLVRALGERLREREIYFAGPPAMAAAMKTTLHDVGVSPAQMHYDEFY